MRYRACGSKPKQKRVLPTLQKRYHVSVLAKIYVSHELIPHISNVLIIPPPCSDHHDLIMTLKFQIPKYLRKSFIWTFPNRILHDLDYKQ